MTRRLHLVALGHHELHRVDLRRVVLGAFGHDGAVLGVPEDQRAVTRARREVAITFTNLDVDDHILVTVQRGLQLEGLLVPHLDDAARVRERYLPVVGAGEDHAVAHIELGVVDRRRVAFSEVRVPEHSFHPVELSFFLVQNTTSEPLHPGVRVKLLGPPAVAQEARAWCQVRLEALGVRGPRPLRKARNPRREVTDQTTKIFVKHFCRKTRKSRRGQAQSAEMIKTYLWNALARGFCLRLSAFA